MSVDRDTPPFAYRPDYATHPGELIREMYEAEGINQHQLAGLCRVSDKHMNQVCTGTKPLSATLAVEIELALRKHGTADVLMRMQANCDVFAARSALRVRLQELQAYIAEESL